MNEKDTTKEIILNVLDQWKDTQFNIASATAREYLAESVSIAMDVHINRMLEDVNTRSGRHEPHSRDRRFE